MLFKLGLAIASLLLYVILAARFGLIGALPMMVEGAENGAVIAAAGPHAVRPAEDGAQLGILRER